MTSSRKPKMAITLGDPAGVGPETVIQAMASPLIHDICDPFVIGHCLEIFIIFFIILR